MSRVLIMDDEIIIRNSAGRVLSRMGHEVQYASHGEEVIALYQKEHASQRAFDVVILDLIIRDGMGGHETLVHLRRIDPHVKAIVSSGSTTDPAILEYAHMASARCLRSPMAGASSLRHSRRPWMRHKVNSTMASPHAST